MNMLNEIPDNETKSNGDEAERALRLVIGRIVGETDRDRRFVLKTFMILERAEADGILELIGGFTKDAKKVLEWWLKGAVGCRLIDSQSRAFELGYYIHGEGYPIRFEPKANGDEAGRALRLVIGRIVGEAVREVPPVLKTGEILERAEADGMLELIVGFPKDPKKAIGWLLKSLRGRHLIDSQGRAFEVGRRELYGEGCPIRFMSGPALSEQPARARDMDTTPMHPLIDAVTKPSATVTPLENWQIAEVKAVGGGRDDLRALCYAEIGEERDQLHRFLLNFHRHRANVMPAFENLADEAVRKGFPERLGCDTLAATARFLHLSFPLSNNDLPGYVIALRIKRPDLAGMLDAEAAWPLALLRAGWNPWREEVAS